MKEQGAEIAFTYANELMEKRVRPISESMKAKTSEEIPYALIAELVEIDSQKLVYEDILEMELSDVIALQAEISGKLQTAAASKITAEEVPEEKLEVTTPLTETITSLTSPTANA